MAGKNTRMQQWLQYTVRVTVKDGRKFVGTLIAFDKHMNLVLADCEEFRMTKGKEGKEIKRTLGFILLRGENIVSFTAKAPPAASLMPFGAAGPGKAIPAGRGTPIMPGMTQQGMPHMQPNAAALQAPMRGLIGAAPLQLAPQGVAGTMPPRPT
ncbi:small nuclear ribonucleoprotein-associated protein B, putative [Theileria equi strain WA]|uniref:Sm protein B n=1 Tax=Theileria equi strain WA TaxID=1537102 RepID=L0AWG1_THEEQ|nr:small nuclear ribonucleoprotein-associated protein B, putative [Theileria equi strain WA]AFZ79249.1 small nuclear ribonucleoprotein-associated protein B, putative [Theileria equi strain WA]|eukprot:XP_004828915.1 small nuclear ribonucleoprotein-associated protein B, putative [Theileria equi strain WA]